MIETTDNRTMKLVVFVIALNLFFICTVTGKKILNGEKETVRTTASNTILTKLVE